VVVTLRDLRERLVRFAVVSFRKLDAAKNTLRRTRLGFSNRKGLASFLVGLARSMVGRRLLLRIGARTPHASARAMGSLLVTERVTRRGTIRHITYV
jgi:hypothetical protein